MSATIRNQDSASLSRFMSGIRETATSLFKDLSFSGRFKDEERESSCGYPSDYKPKGIAEQATLLREVFPGIGYADERLALGALPPNAEGWFAIPRWEAIAPTYDEAVETVLCTIARMRGGMFFNSRRGYHRQTSHTKAAFRKLGHAQEDYGILVTPAQFGLRHRGRSARRAREVFAPGEFGLDTFATAVMILTHPERFMHEDDLGVDCCGDKFDDIGPENPCPNLVRDFCFKVGVVWMEASYIHSAYGGSGSATGFDPKGLSLNS
jgi:hypothetical protein